MYGYNEYLQNRTKKDIKSKDLWVFYNWDLYNATMYVNLNTICSVEQVAQVILRHNITRMGWCCDWRFPFLKTKKCSFPLSGIHSCLSWLTIRLPFSRGNSCSALMGNWICIELFAHYTVEDAVCSLIPSSALYVIVCARVMERTQNRVWAKS